MKLSDLRTPPPLRDSDYAAIRARVMAEIAHDRQRRPFWRLAFALAVAATLATVLLLIPNRAGTPSREAAVSRPASSPLVTAAPPAHALATASTTPPARASTTSNQQPETSNRAARVARRVPPQQLRRESAVPMSIEIHTADPDVRIIWIVSTDNAREES